VQQVAYLNGADLGDAGGAYLNGADLGDAGGAYLNGADLGDAGGVPKMSTLPFRWVTFFVSDIQSSTIPSLANGGDEPRPSQSSPPFSAGLGSTRNHLAGHFNFFITSMTNHIPMKLGTDAKSH